MLLGWTRSLCENRQAGTLRIYAQRFYIGVRLQWQFTLESKSITPPSTHTHRASSIWLCQWTWDTSSEFTSQYQAGCNWNSADSGIIRPPMTLTLAMSPGVPSGISMDWTSSRLREVNGIGILRGLRPEEMCLLLRKPGTLTFPTSRGLPGHP